MTDQKWRKSKMWIAFSRGPETRNGWEYKGLGLFSIGGKYSLTHLGTGMRIALLPAPIAAAKKTAVAVAECANWEWSGPDGYKNVEPEVRAKLRKCLAELGIDRPMGNATREDQRAAAREIARLRA